jgi:hypothetical protein
MEKRQPDPFYYPWTRLAILGGVVLLLGLGMALLSSPTLGSAAPAPPEEVLEATATPRYIVVAWNDLGMHCYNRDFQWLALLPPANTLVAQVIRVGNPPQIITTGITVTYFFTDNTYSTLPKSNFWVYAHKIFSLTQPLTPNIGLTGKGLSGTMDVRADHFIAEWIPLTEFRDSAPGTRYPYQLATIVVQDQASGAELARQIVVAPVSTEMHCDNCHADGGVGGIRTGVVERNILRLHDNEEGTRLEADALAGTPALCARCHASNTLGMPGQSGLPNLSRAMHNVHKGKVPDTQAGCYNCHPGPETQCQRDVMLVKYNITCPDCHGGMASVASSTRQPWLTEPRCDTCHTGDYQQNNPLYHLSTGHGGLYCEACHDSPHAIAPSREPNDGLKFIALQGYAGPLRDCNVCHTSTELGPGPHGLLPPAIQARIYLPLVLRQ